MPRSLIAAPLLSLLLGSSLAVSGCGLDSNPESLVAPAPSVDAALLEPKRSLVGRAQRQIEQREYWASKNRDGLQAPNRQHNLRTYFEPDGIRLVDRSEIGSPDLLTMRLDSLGRENDLVEVGPGVVTSDGARVEIQRDAVLEWYVNAPFGLEQGFTLMERPSG